MPDIERDCLPRFKKYAGGEAWLDKGKPSEVKARKDVPKVKKDSSKTKKTNGF